METYEYPIPFRDYLPRLGCGPSAPGRAKDDGPGPGGSETRS